MRAQPIAGVRQHAAEPHAGGLHPVDILDRHLRAWTWAIAGLRGTLAGRSYTAEIGRLVRTSVLLEMNDSSPRRMCHRVRAPSRVELVDQPAHMEFDGVG